MQLKKGDKLTMTADKAFKKFCTKEKVFVIQGFIMRAKVGDKIFIDDGPLCFKVTKKGIHISVYFTFYVNQSTF